MTLAGKHVVVTGGGSGVGAETAQAFNRQGARVTILGRREEPLKAQGLSYQLCDVTDAEAVAKALDAARQQNGPISVAVANAGAVESVPFAKLSQDQMQSMLAVNLIGVANLWQAALGDMKASGWGRMLAVASTAGLKGYPYVAVYSAAKHGVIGLTRSLAIELGQTGVTVNAICPSFVETPLLERSIETIVQKTGLSAEDARATLIAGNPQQRFIETDEVAGTALWLCSDAARSVNGQAIALSGGEV